MEASNTTAVESPPPTTHEAEVAEENVGASPKSINVEIVSRSGSTQLSVPVSLMVERELEMKGSALHFEIPKERWNGSLLYKKWKAEGLTSFTLQPDKECADKNYSHTFQWSPWLSDLVQAYYETGKLRIPSDCQGYDLLLSLEYFGILYQPDQLVFDSYASYARVKHWSDYLTQRAPLADWVAEYVLSNSQPQYTFATTPDKSDETIEVANRSVELLASESSLHEAYFGFFNVAEKDDSKKTCPDVAMQMRDDFCMYLQNLLTDVRVSFPVQAVTIHSTGDEGQRIRRQEARAILTVEVVSNYTFRSKSELSFPVDEMVEEDLKAGTLEDLVQKADKRNRSPRQVTDFHHVYQDLAREGAESKTAMNAGIHVYEELAREAQLLEGKNEEEKKEDTVQVEEKKRASPTFVFSPTEGNALLDAENAAPVTVVRAGTSDNSVTSTLTGPLFVDSDGNLKELPDSTDPQTQALRHEWIQGGLLNRGMAERIESLLRTEQANPPAGDGSDSKKNPWDWLTGLGLCDYPSSLLQKTSPGDGTEDPRMTKQREATASAMKAAAASLMQGVESGKQVLLSCEQPSNAVADETDDVAVALPTSPGRSRAGTERDQASHVSRAKSATTVKDRLAMNQKFLEQSREDSTQIYSRGIMRAEGHEDTRDQDDEQGVEVSHADSLEHEEKVQDKPQEEEDDDNQDDQTRSVATPSTTSSAPKSSLVTADKRKEKTTPVTHKKTGARRIINLFRRKKAAI